jgi:hypothetical protein
MNVFLKELLGRISCYVFFAKNSVFRLFLSLTVKSPVFGAIFVYFGQLGAYLPPLTPSTTTPCLGTPPPPKVGAPSSF